MCLFAISVWICRNMVVFWAFSMLVLLLVQFRSTALSVWRTLHNYWICTIQLFCLWKTQFPSYWNIIQHIFWMVGMRGKKVVLFLKMKYWYSSCFYKALVTNAFFEIENGLYAAFLWRLLLTNRDMDDMSFGTCPSFKFSFVFSTELLNLYYNVFVALCLIAL